MGIDVYARFDGQTGEQHRAQMCGFDTTKGNVGYLREAYHGEPYATKVLVPEAFAAEECEAPISAAVMRARLPEVERVALVREATIYKNKNLTRDDPTIKSFRDFVEYCEAAEAVTGMPCTIIASY